MQEEILKAAAEAQKKRYIDKCPCCGHDNMYSDNGKTCAILSNHANIYICSSCQVVEWEEQNLRERYQEFVKEHPQLTEDEYKRIMHYTPPLPLSQWAIFNPEYTQVFMQDETTKPANICIEECECDCISPI